MMSSVVLAKALYSNDSEADDELSFKKGDVITVLETDFEGMVGWWLCSLGDKQGVAPGNRLQLISFDDDATVDPQEIYDTPGQAYKERYGDVDYDIPKPHPGADFDDYATPKSPYGNYPVPDSQRHGFVLPSPRAVSAATERNSNSSDGLVTNEIYAAPSSRWSGESRERSSDEFRFSGEMSHGSGSEEMYDVPSRDSMESDDGQRNLSLHVPVLPPKARTVSNGYHGNLSREGSQEIYDSPTAHDVTDVNTRYSNHSDGVYDQLPGDDVKQLDQLMRTISGNSEDYATIPSPGLAGPQDIYDVPPTVPEELYDTLPNAPEEMYDVPPNAPEELYDVLPANHEEVYDVLPACPEEVYDVPPAGSDAFYDKLPSGEKQESIYKRNSFDVPADGNNNPPVLPRSMDNDDGLYEELPDGSSPEAVYDNFAELEKGAKTAGGTGTLGRKQRHESDDYVDYQEIYGIGEDEPTKKKDGQKEEQCVLERIHMDKVRELRVSHVIAMHSLDKLQQAVDVAVTKLMSFVTDDWRRSEVYALNINGIREISGKVKVAIRLLTEFGLGALKNSQKLSDGEISRKIEEALKPLLGSYYSIKTAIQRLDESNWRSAYKESPDDDLNTIARLAQGIPCGAYNLGAVIANVSCILFTTEVQDKVATQPETNQTQNSNQNLLSSSQSETTKRPEARRSSPDRVSPRSSAVQNSLSPSTAPTKSPEARRSSPDRVSPRSSAVQNSLSPSTAPNDTTKSPEARRSSQDPASPRSSTAAQIESTRKPVSSKVEAEQVGNQPKLNLQATKTPPAVSPKPKKDRQRSDSAPNAQLLSDQVSELTNNLLNQIDNIKTPASSLCRKGSKKLSPKTVRRLCSITLKNDDRINEKIFEDVAAIPAKPSRESSSPATPENPTTMFGKRASLSGTVSDPSSLHSSADILQQNGFESMKSFVEKMNSEFMVLKEGIKSFGESVRERQKPKIFVAHSKFIVLSAHKLVYIGDGASRSISNADDRSTISVVTNSLSEVINNFVENIKIAARQYPEEEPMNTMIKSATNVTEKALALYKALKRQS